MAKFLTSNELNHEVEQLLDNAEKQIILISPYIKLHDRYISVLKTKVEKPELKITIVFGKNENNLSKSMKIDDFNFLKTFPNIEICYEARLHAKYYANESAAILTSMNLYNFSQDNNIEFGVLAKSSFFGEFGNFINEDSFDFTADEYFKRVISQSKVLFSRVPIYEKINFGISKKYQSSNIKIDTLSDFFANKSNGIPVKPKQNKHGASPIEINTGIRTGFCIRTGKPIPFELSKPMTQSAYESWSKFKDYTYKEKYCHFSGEASNGLTSFKKPILPQYYKKAKEFFEFV